MTIPAFLQQAIIVFDSGIGGLPILKEIRQRLPHEKIVYFADSAYLPYGEKSPVQIQQRMLQLCHWFFQHQVKALVIACNTATVHAVAQIRAHYPQQCIIGVEPGLKPAQSVSKSGVIGILATKSTLASYYFRSTLMRAKKENQNIKFVCRAGTGLVPFVEENQINSPASWLLLQKHLRPMLNKIDTLVLGCTHYVFFKDLIVKIIGSDITIIDTSSAVARSLCLQLEKRNLCTTKKNKPELLLLASRGPKKLADALQRMFDEKIAAPVVVKSFS